MSVISNDSDSAIAAAGKKRPRLGLAAAIAPLSAPVFYLAGAMAFAGFPVAGLEDLVGGLFMVAFFAVPFAYLATLCLGLPLVWVLDEIDRLTFWHVTLSAVPLGALTFLVFEILALGHASYVFGAGGPAIVGFVLTGGALGFGVAVVFCRIAGIGPAFRKSLNHRQGPP